jgi:hypothetical protein
MQAPGRTRTWPLIRMMLLLLAGLFLAKPAAAQAPNLEPAPYKPLPVGTQVWYGDRGFAVKNTKGLELELQLSDGDWISLYGLFLKAGSWQYTSSSNYPFVSRIDDEDVAALKKFWPLEVGKRADIIVTETHDGSNLPRDWKINLQVTSTEIVSVAGARYATYVITETGIGEAFSSGGGSMETAEYLATHWYEPGSGLIVKSTKIEKRATGRDQFSGKQFSSELRSATFPAGTTSHALRRLEAAPQQVAVRSMSEAAKDSAAWEAVKFSNRVADFQRYLKEHPSGMFVKLAENQMRSLIERQTNPTAASEALAGIQFGNYHALVIGANNYKHLPKLQTAINDAKAIAAKLTTEYDFKVRLLLDPTRDAIINAFDDYLETLEFQDNLLIYYAGHGWLEEATDRGYWLPVDAKEGRRSKWLSNADITDTLKSLAAKHVMVIADSCYSGTLTRSAAVGLRDANYLQRIAKKRARVAMVSGGLEPVADDGGDGNSPFARAFLSALTDNPDVIDGTRLFAAIRRPVILDAKQTPEYSDVRDSGHDGGDFLFVRK